LRKKTILVNGLLTYDSGKTWFTISLFKTLAKNGVKAVPYKPVAAHNFWFSARTIKYSIKMKKLVGNDAYMYFRKTTEPPELLNPIALAIAPLDPVNYVSNIEKYLDDASSFLPQLVLGRISHYTRGETIHFVIQENVERTVRDAQEVVKILKKKLGAVEKSLREVGELLVSQRIDDVTSQVLNTLLEKYDIVLLESFNDAVIPSIGLAEHVDLIITVAPGRAFIYDRTATKNILQYLIQRVVDPSHLVTPRFFSIFKPKEILNTPLMFKPGSHNMLKPVVDFILRE